MCEALSLLVHKRLESVCVKTKVHCEHFRGFQKSLRHTTSVDHSKAALRFYQAVYLVPFKSFFLLY